jgi:hypothetical protein
MARMISTPQTKGRKTLLKKFIKDIEISNPKIRGTFSISGYRQYFYYCELDVEFKGEIWVRFNRTTGWFSPKDLIKKGASKVRVNRMVRQKLLPEISYNTLCFSVVVRCLTDIKKLNYI